MHWTWVGCIFWEGHKNLTKSTNFVTYYIVASKNIRHIFVAFSEYANFYWAKTNERYPDVDWFNVADIIQFTGFGQASFSTTTMNSRYQLRQITFIVDICGVFSDKIIEIDFVCLKI